jgi:PAS domain-containing protein
MKKFKYFLYQYNKDFSHRGGALSSAGFLQKKSRLRGEYMIWQENPYTIPLMIASLVSIVLGVYLGFRRRNLGDIMGMVLILANTECIFAYAFELASADLDTKIFWNNMQFIGLAIIPTVWLMYALWYTGRKNWLTRRIVAGLTIVPGITLVLTFTNEHHKLMCSAAYLLTNYPFLVLEKTYGTFFWFYIVYSYVLIIFALLILVHMLIHSRSFYRWQASALLCGAVIPWAAATLFVSDANPLPYLNLIPVAFVVTNIMVSFSITYLRLGDVVPLAWETIIENMGDSVIVLDEESRILDINISAQNILGACIGESVDTLPGWFNNGRPGNTEDKEIVLDHKNEKRTYDVRISPLVDWRGYAVSRVVVLRDTLQY